MGNPLVSPFRNIQLVDVATAPWRSPETRRLLLVAYHYPPSLESGAIRPGGLAKYLREFGWDVLVLVPQMQGPRPGNVIETDCLDVIAEWKRRLGLNPYRALSEQPKLSSAWTKSPESLRYKTVKAIRSVLTYPDQHKGWRRYAVAAVRELRDQNIEAVISTAPPLVCHAIAKEAKQVLGCPWIADYRDLWNVDAKTLYDRKGVVGAIQRRTERNILSTADALVAVSAPWAGRLRDRYPTKPSYSITNGFDPDEMVLGEQPLSSKFTITHTGMLYKGKRDPSLLLESLRELIDSGEIEISDLLLRFYGQQETFMPPLLQHYGLERVTELRPSVPRQEMLKLQRESQILLVLNWSGQTENGGHTGKVFEYLAACRPILAHGGVRGVLANLLDETQTGVHVESKTEMRNALREAYREYKRHGRVLYRGNAETIRRYSQREMARKFARVLSIHVPQRAGVSAA
jgi:glycosyltransferase involved in cell wall biosynthesis